MELSNQQCAGGSGIFTASRTVSEFCNRSGVTESTCVNESFVRNIDLPGELAQLPNMDDVPVCDDLVDLSGHEHVRKATNNNIVVHPDLEGLVLPADTSTIVSTVSIERPISNEISFKMRNHSPSIDGKICDLPLTFLCDIGAAISAVSSALVQRLPCRPYQAPPDALPTPSIRRVSGELLPIEGAVLLTFQIGAYKYPFYSYIVDELAYDVILGADFSTHHACVINFDIVPWNYRHRLTNHHLVQSSLFHIRFRRITHLCYHHFPNR